MPPAWEVIGGRPQSRFMDVFARLNRFHRSTIQPRYIRSAFPGVMTTLRGRFGTESLLIMELRHLRYFTALAEELHFGRAADAVFVAQSTLSQQIRAFEDEMGVQFFERSTGGVDLTEAGRTFLPYAKRVLREARRAESVAQAARLSPCSEDKCLVHGWAAPGGALCERPCQRTGSQDCS